MGVRGLRVASHQERVNAARMGVMREPDLIWEVVVEVCGADSSRMTKSERGRYNKAVKELKEVEATPDEIRARAGRYKIKWPNLDVTPTALAAHWSSLAAPRSMPRIPAANPMGRGGITSTPVPTQTPEEREANRKRIAEMVEGIGKPPSSGGPRNDQGIPL